MRRIAVTSLALAVGLAACATGMGGPKDVRLSAVALRAESGTTPAAAAAALREVGARVGLVAAPADSAWFRAVAEAAGLHLSGPAVAGDLSLALLAMEPLGDTVLTLDYEGGTITMVDALYDLADEHFLDLMAFRVGAGDPIQPMVTRLLRYIATDVPPSAGVVIAIAVPDAAAGDSIARLLSPGYLDAIRCAGGDPGTPATGRIRLFYGPAARVVCGDAAVVTVPAGARVHAELVAGLHL
ncbi:MAG TPA: hypothetical protein VMM12_02595 [Longimicrobiales bacterium]|nr:hypothetical protein [Longimicrobiales bacterium]